MFDTEISSDSDRTDGLCEQEKSLEGGSRAARRSTDNWPYGVNN